MSQWRDSLKVRNKRFYSGAGFGYGADMNGLAQESQPTSGDPIRYPLNSYDGRVTFTREQWGQRVFDINADGVANDGSYLGVSTERSRAALISDIRAAGLS